MDGRTDGWMDGRTDGWTDGRTDGNIDKLKVVDICGCKISMFALIADSVTKTLD